MITTCPVCSEEIEQPVVTLCGHLFCQNCINESFEGKTEISCPECDSLVKKEGVITIFLPSKESSSGNEQSSDLSTDSSSNPSQSGVSERSTSTGYGFWSELHEASAVGAWGKVKFLMKAGSNIQMRSDKKTNGKCAIHFASEHGHLEIVKLFIKADKSLAYAKSIGQNLLPIHCACLNGHLNVVIYFLNELKMPIDITQNIYGRTPLHCACEKGHMRLVSYLVKNDANPWATTNDNDGKETPVHFAAFFGYLKILRLFLEKVDPGLLVVINMEGMTPLHKACLGGHLDIVQHLIEREKINVDIRTLEPSKTPIHCACQSGNLAVVNYLIGRNASIRSLSGDGKTCLHYAAYWGHLEVVEYLLRHAPALLSIKDENNETALDWVRESSQPGVNAVIRYLE